MSLFVKGQAPIGLKQEKFYVSPDVYLILREMSSKELMDYQEKFGDKDVKNLDMIYDLISKVALDDNGLPIFTSAQDVKENLDIGLSKFVEIQEKILDLSGLSPKN